MPNEFTFAPKEPLANQINAGVREVAQGDLQTPKSWQKIPTQDPLQNLSRLLLLGQGAFQAHTGMSPLDLFGAGPVSNARRQFAPIAADARRALTNEYAPKLAERFTALGINSPNNSFSQSLAGAAGDLESKLAALEAQNVLQTQSQRERLIPSFLQEGFRPGFQPVYGPKMEGLQSLNGNENVFDQLRSLFGAQINESGPQTTSINGTNDQPNNNGGMVDQFKKLLGLGGQTQQATQGTPNNAVDRNKANYERLIANGPPKIQQIGKKPENKQLMQKYAELSPDFGDIHIVRNNEFGKNAMGRLVDLMQIAKDSGDKNMMSGISLVDTIKDLENMYSFFTTRDKKYFNKLPKSLRSVLDGTVLKFA